MTAAPYRHVFFDVDSTLVTIEGIDELADGNPEIKRLTDAAMNGDIPVDQVYGRRLEIIKPSRARIEKLGEHYIASIVPGAIETIRALREKGVVVHLVTAGIEQAIRPLATHLGLDRVNAVRVFFNDDGSYRDFDRRSFLTRPGGKEIVVRDARARSHGRAAFVGDGVTDLDTRPAVDLFIGFGGVAVRDKVKAAADVYVTDSDLRAILTHLL